MRSGGVAYEEFGAQGEKSVLGVFSKRHWYNTVWKARTSFVAHILYFVAMELAYIFHALALHMPRCSLSIFSRLYSTV